MTDPVGGMRERVSDERARELGRLNNVPVRRLAADLLDARTELTSLRAVAEAGRIVGEIATPASEGWCFVRADVIADLRAALAVPRLIAQGDGDG